MTLPVGAREFATDTFLAAETFLRLVSGGWTIYPASGSENYWPRPRRRPWRSFPELVAQEKSPANPLITRLRGYATVDVWRSCLGCLGGLELEG